MICELLFPSSILAVKLNRKTLVIVLETEIYIYDISNMRLLHVIETAPNPDGKYTMLFVSIISLTCFAQQYVRSPQTRRTRTSHTLHPFHHPQHRPPRRRLPLVYLSNQQPAMCSCFRRRP